MDFDMGLIRGLITLAMFVLFVGIAAWTYLGKNKSDFDATAALPLADDLPSEPNQQGEAS